MGQMVISGSRELTQRDLAIVEWIGRVGAVTIEHVARRFRLSRTRAYACVGRCVAMGLLERWRVLHRAPALLVASRAGLAGAGLPLPYARISPALARHHEACGSVAVWLAEAYPSCSILSERELRHEELVVGRPVGSAKVGELPSGAPRLHRPDFAVIGDCVQAFEVELTPKAPSGLRAWCGRGAALLTSRRSPTSAIPGRSALSSARSRARAPRNVFGSWRCAR